MRVGDDLVLGFVNEEPVQLEATQLSTLQQNHTKLEKSGAPGPLWCTVARREGDGGVVD